MAMGIGERAELDALTLEVQELRARQSLVFEALASLFAGKKPFKLTKQVSALANETDEGEDDSAAA
jgi:hypothetical protein